MYSRTATQFDLMVKTIMVVLFMFGLFIFFIDVTKAADFWVSDPALCPQSFESLWPGVDAQPQRICGVNPDPSPNGTMQPYDTWVLTPPVITAISVANHAASTTGGYLINCFASTVGRSEPYCSNNGNFWCNRSPVCFNSPTNKETICTANQWAQSTCGGCITGYGNCNSNPTTCEVQFNTTAYPTGINNRYGVDCSSSNVRCMANWYKCEVGNDIAVDGCETRHGNSCSAGGGLTGVWNCVAGGGTCTDGISPYTCTCVPPISNFQTGIESMYSTTSPLLWGKQFGTGDLISFSNATSSNIFVVKNDASIFMSSTLATTTDKYFYNYNGDLYWGDEKLNTGGGITYTAGDGLNLNGYEFTINTSSDFIWSGQHTFNATTTFPLGVWGFNGKVGIGTTTPSFALSLVVDAYDGMTIYNTSSQMLAGIGSNPTGLSGGMGLFNAGTMIPAISFDAGASSFINNNYNFGIGTTTPSSKLTLAGDFDIAKNGLLRFNGISGSVDQVIKINASGFPEWVDVNSLFINNTTFNSSTEFNSTSTFNSSSIFNDTTEFNSTSTFNSMAIFNNPTIFNDNVFVSGTIYSDNLTVYGTTTLNDIYVTGQAIFHDILPEHNLAYTLGTSSLVWKEGWFGKIFTPEIDFTNNWKLSTTTDGGLAFTSSTQIALAILSTGQVGINTTTVEANLKMKVDGNIGSRMYCDINGENCFNPIFGWAHPQATYSTTTPAMFQGNLNTSTLVGYQAGDNICQFYFGSEYHMCSTEDVFNIIHTQDLTQFIVNDSEGWVANGPPGYVANSNDCAGWTVSSSLYYGAYWSFSQNGGGQGKLTTCNLTRPISCCK